MVLNQVSVNQSMLMAGSKVESGFLSLPPPKLPETILLIVQNKSDLKATCCKWYSMTDLLLRNQKTVSFIDLCPEDDLNTN